MVKKFEKKIICSDFFLFLENIEKMFKKIFKIENSQKY
jgi:hypothetical protein